MSEPKKPWHLDKTVNISVIIGLLGQAVVFGTWVGVIQTKVTVLEVTVDKQQAIPERLARIEEKLTAIIERLDRERR